LFISGLVGVFLMAVLLFLVGCADLPMEHSQLSRVTISTSEAAHQAAQMANDACERQYQERPFQPEQYRVGVERGRYQWGGDDTNALSGLFALVTFELDGSYPEVTIYYHTSSP
jgi:hypothetical protein